MTQKSIVEVIDEIINNLRMITKEDDWGINGNEDYLKYWDTHAMLMDVRKKYGGNDDKL